MTKASATSSSWSVWNVLRGEWPPHLVGGSRGRRCDMCGGAEGCVVCESAIKVWPGVCVRVCYEEGMPSTVC